VAYKEPLKDVLPEYILFHAAAQAIINVFAAPWLSLIANKSIL
jgi:hypothetical protein